MRDNVVRTVPRHVTVYTGHVMWLLDIVIVRVDGEVQHVIQVCINHHHINLACILTIYSAHKKKLSALEKGQNFPQLIVI